MFIELFAGTLTRYYSEQWQNARTRAGGEGPFYSATSNNVVTDPVELQGEINKWREDCSTKLKEHLPEPLTWQEGMSPPYEVGELSFEGYGGAILLSAYVTSGYLPRPTTFQKTWNKDVAIESLANEAKGNTLWEIMNCSLWLPNAFQFGIGLKDPSGQSMRAGSIEVLWTALQHLNETNWKASPERIHEWRKIQLNESISFDAQSQFGFSVFYEMCKFAREKRLPMKLHY